MLGEYDQSGAAIREYVWLGSTPVAVFTPDPASGTNPPLVYYIHADHLDTPRVVTDTAGNLRWRWLVEPLGGSMCVLEELRVTGNWLRSHLPKCVIVISISLGLSRIDVHAEQHVACGACTIVNGSLLMQNCSSCTAKYDNADSACAALTPYLETVYPGWLTYDAATFVTPSACQITGTRYNTATGQVQPNSGTGGYLFGCGDGYQMYGPAGTCMQTIDVYVPPPKRCSLHVNPGYGDPIYPLTGSEARREPLGFSLGGLSAELTYDSFRAPWANEGLYVAQVGATRVLGQLGKLWWSSLHRQLVFVPGRVNVFAVRGHGVQVVSFSFGNDGWKPPADQRDRLEVVIQDGVARYFYRDQEELGLEVYDTSGRLQQWVFASGRTLSPSYSTASTPVSVAPAAGYLIRLDDSFGRSISFSYQALTSGDVVIDRIHDSEGQIIAAGYDGGGNLASLTWQDQSVRSFVYDSLNSNQSWALTGVIDENQSRHATVAYAPGGWAVSSELGGGVDRHVVSYLVPPQPVVTEVPTNDSIWRYHEWIAPVGTSVRLPNGADLEISAQAVLVRDPLNAPDRGAPRLAGVSQPAGSGCAASSSALSYDANGNVASRDDFNGKRVCYANDLSRNLETVRVEGLANTTTCSTVTGSGATLPTGSRKVSSAWHPDWRLETKVAEPGRLVTSVYNGQPDPFNGNATASCAPSTALLPDGKPIVVLCKRVEQATTDATGAVGLSATLQSGVANRTWQWTYNGYGQVLTEDGPRTDVSDITTYVYYSSTTDEYTKGDLQQVTNAAGQVTSYPLYNKHGQVLRQVDPNGVITDSTYDLRQRLTSVSVGGQTTSYSYDAVGQLKRLTQPDGSWVGYEYDAAHRQVAVLDSQGNRIDYTLDNAGNRTAEQVSDPSGALARQIARSFDALGRLQQSTGQH